LITLKIRIDLNVKSDNRERFAMMHPETKPSHGTTD